jgi:hypothetical protein
VIAEAAGRNRQLRSVLRALQLAGAASWIALIAATATGRARGPAAAAVVGTGLLKSGLFLRYVRQLQFEAGDLAALIALQPALDVAYASGILSGLRQLARRENRGPI